MLFCSKCGNSINEGTLFCPNCGAYIGEKTNQNINVRPPQFEEKEKPLNYHIQQNYQSQFTSQNKPNIDTTGLIIWTVINLIFFWPLAIYSFIVISRVKKAESQQEAQSIYEKAKKICAINSGIAVLLIIIGIAVS
ncbi:zinc ribbon domain-containing protein [Clostridium sp.]|uniref:zinc-ribbon domain-containing protein n=1 Tax=Clostridium sp. TaxID=1506 RepID=UPI002612E744|nr:zinc ribbon domain-containing protein [Clostridium sp.]